MEKKLFLILTLFCFYFHASAQFTRYIVRFTDKNGSSFSINTPSQFLSQRAIERRQKQQIPIDESDLPVVQKYIDSVRLAGNVIVLDQSKWFNQVCIETTDPGALEKISHFPFVVKTSPVKRVMKNIDRNMDGQREKFKETVSRIATVMSPPAGEDFYSYGSSFDQVHIHNGEYLHNQGFRGKGMLIAVIDAGFYHYKVLPAFDSVNTRNRILETYDFVANETSVNEDDPHGMMCFSTIASNIPGKLVGTSPDASFLLYRSEDVSSESPVEEQYWIAAAERADSAGADVITTSLGYTEFDNPVFDYSYDDLNGKTTPIAIAATIAARKGMIVLAAAGNEGNNRWHYIATPADADSILAVGAVSPQGIPASFSSYGPSADGRVKPDVASVGSGTAVSDISGAVAIGSGTSFATPNLAGLVTCLWQAFPEFTNMEIISAVKKSSSIYMAPDNRIGYGIPDFKKAYENLLQQRIIKTAGSILGKDFIKAYPNPFRNYFTVLINPPHSGNASLKLFDASGKLFMSQEISVTEGAIQQIPFNNLPALQKGVYFLRFNDGKSKHSIQLLVQ